jgi:hypothetical protein
MVGAGIFYPLEGVDGGSERDGMKKNLKKEPKITESELCAAMEEARRLAMRDVLAERPAGYFSAREYAQRHGLEYAAAWQQLEALARRGRLVKVRALAPNSAGVRKPGTAYGLAENAR